MKKLSLKVKLTLLYTFFMVLLTCAALAILFSLSSREMLSSVQARLTQRVQESIENIDLRGDEVRLDSDFYSVSHDVILPCIMRGCTSCTGGCPTGSARSRSFRTGKCGRSGRQQGMVCV